jgi:hypothetical protein
VEDRDRFQKSRDVGFHRNRAMKVTGVFEDQATKHHQESSPYAFASTLEVRCLCGDLRETPIAEWLLAHGIRPVNVV